MRGAFLGGALKVGQGAAPAAGRHAGLGRPGAPPGGHYGPPARSWLTAAQALRKAWPGIEKSRSRAPRGAPLRSQGEAARLASVPGWFAAAPGASQAPAFLGVPLPSRGALKEKRIRRRPARHDKRAAERWLFDN